MPLLMSMEEAGVKICMVVMIDDHCYADVKFISDVSGMPTQCLRWKNVVGPPRYGTVRCCTVLHTALAVLSSA